MAGLTVTNWMALVIITASEMIEMFRGAIRREYGQRIHFWTFGVLLVDTLRQYYKYFAPIRRRGSSL